MNILVVSPHADDETLGAGGTILKYKKQGHKLYWLNVTSMKVEYGYSESQVIKRKNEIENLISILSFDGFYNLELSPAELEKYKSKEIITKISKIINEVQPEVIILPNRNDVHSDHKIVFDWCYSCTKIFRNRKIKKILSMEILSETDFAIASEGFIPDYFVDISNEFSQKVKALEIYESEIGEHPFPRSITGVEALAKYRGISAGCKYAEAFKVIKIIE